MPEVTDPATKNLKIRAWIILCVYCRSGDDMGASVMRWRGFVSGWGGACVGECLELPLKCLDCLQLLVNQLLLPEQGTGYFIKGCLLVREAGFQCFDTRDQVRVIHDGINALLGSGVSSALQFGCNSC